MTDLFLPEILLPEDRWRDLPEPNFFSRDPIEIEARMIARYEELAEKPLLPAQPERLMINLMTYELTLLRTDGERAARENLLRYATAENLDLLGEAVDVERLLESSSLTTIRFSIEEALTFSVSVPAKTRVGTADQTHVFATKTAAEIQPGATFVDVAADAVTPGVAANGLVPNQVATLIDTPPLITAAANLTTTNSGADDEDNDRYRERIRIAPDSFSVAGPDGAYVFFALAASQTVSDVAVLGPEDGISPGQVHVFPLATTGLPSAELKDLVEAAVSADEKRRPLTDSVSILDPEEVKFAVTGTVTPYDDADANTVLANATAAVQAFVDAMRAKLGTDIVPSQLVGEAAAVAGVYDIVLSAPAANRVLTKQQWANCTAVTLTLASAEEG